VIYLDLIAAVILGSIFYYLTFTLPPEFFPSPLQAEYMKFSASLLLGCCIGLTALLVVEALPRERGKTRLVLPKSLRIRFPIIVVRPKVKPISEAFPLVFISRNKRLRGFAGKMGLRVARDVLEAGETLSPYRLMAKHLFYMLVLFFITVPAGLVLALLVHPVLLAVIIAPAIPLAYPKLKLRSAVGDRKRSLEDEVPFFAVYASILQSVGISLYNSLLSTIGRGVYKQVEKDALMVKRNVEFFFKSKFLSLRSN